MTVVFKDLQKLVSKQQAENTRKEIFERLQGKPFWIWNIEEHKQEDIRTDGDCCFNHIIGLPDKDGVDKPIYDYEKIIFDSLVTQNGNTNFHGNDGGDKRAKMSLSCKLCGDPIMFDDKHISKTTGKKDSTRHRHRRTTRLSCMEEKPTARAATTTATRAAGETKTIL